MRDIELIAHAREMTRRAYAPYSGYRVGAALLGVNGKVYTGCNIESAAFGATLCAERAAIANAFADGCQKFIRAAIISDKNEICTPCGTCRQLLYEFSEHLMVLCCSADGKSVEYSIEELLPHGFGKDSMK